jgi:hypothetical protein
MLNSKVEAAGVIEGPSSVERATIKALIGPALGHAMDWTSCRYAYPQAQVNRQLTAKASPSATTVMKIEN